MKQTIEIEVPDGKKAIWKDGQVIFKDIKPQLPKTWEEFCKQNPIKIEERYIASNSVIYKAATSIFERNPEYDRYILPSKEAAEQHLALIQLHQLRDYYRQDWIPITDKVSFGIIRRVGGYLDIYRFMHSSKFLLFQSEEIAQKFLNNFRDLIEQAGDLI